MVRRIPCYYIIIIVSLFACQPIFAREEALRFEQLGSPFTDYEEYIATHPATPFYSEEIYSSPKTTEKLFYIIVNLDLYSNIQTYLNQYISDLEQMGYSVVVYGATSSGTPQDIRALLQSGYSQGMEGALLIGDLPVAWSAIGLVSGDSLYPIDLYYMDLDGNWEWYDDPRVVINHAGDVAPEIYVGRLAAFKLSGDEASLINSYFERNHELRAGNLQCAKPGEALVFVDDDWAGYPDQGNKWTLFDNMVKKAYTKTAPYVTPEGATEDTTIKNYYAGKTSLYPALEDGYEWVRVMAHTARQEQYHKFKYFGDFEFPKITSADIKWSASSMFYDLFACFAGRYTTPDYIGGWYLFSDGTTGPENKGLGVLASTKSGGLGGLFEGGDFYEPFGYGENIGEAFLRWFKKQAEGGFDSQEQEWFYGMTLLGDPTLHIGGFSYQSFYLSGFPIAIIDREISSSPISIDLNGDSSKELIIASNDSLYVYHSTGDRDWAKGLGANIVGSPAIGDINRDDKLEIIIGSSSGWSGKLRALKPDGTLIWQVSTPPICSSPVLADLAGDNKLEIVIGLVGEIGKGASEILRVLNYNGDTRWSYSSADMATSLAIGKLDGDEEFDIVMTAISTHDSIFAFQGSTGDILWKRCIEECGSSSPILADVDNDGDLEIILGSTNGIITLHGETGTNFGLVPISGVAKNLVVGDIDEDGDLEGIACTEDGKIYVIYDFYGIYKSPFYSCYELAGEIYSPPCLGDIDGDSEIEIVVNTTRGTYILNLDGSSILSGSFIGRGTKSSVSLIGLNDDEDIEIVSGDLFGDIHVWNFEGKLPRVEWAKFRHGYYNTANYRFPPISPTGLNAWVDEWCPYPYRCIVKLTWNPNSEPNLQKYKVYKRESGQSAYTYIGSTTSTSFSLTLYPKPGKKYYFYITAVDWNNNESSPSNVDWVFPIDAIPPRRALVASIGEPARSEYTIQRDGFREYGNFSDYSLYPEFAADWGGDTLIYSFGDLDLNKKYRVAITFYTDSSEASRVQVVSIDGYSIITNHHLLCGKPEIVTSWVPQAAYIDGGITLKIGLVNGENVVASELMLMEYERGSGGAQTAYSNIPMVHSLSLYPNPARNEMTTRFGIPREERVSLKVYDVSGREVKTLVDGRLEAGYHTIRLDGKGLPSGIYFARLVTDNYKATKKLVLMK